MRVQAAHRSVNGGAAIFESLRFVSDRHLPTSISESLNVASQRRITGNDDAAFVTAYRLTSSAMQHGHRQLRRKLFEFSVPDANHAGRAHH